MQDYCNTSAACAPAKLQIDDDTPARCERAHANARVFLKMTSYAEKHLQPAYRRALPARSVPLKAETIKKEKRDANLKPEFSAKFFNSNIERPVVLPAHVTADREVLSDSISSTVNCVSASGFWVVSLPQQPLPRPNHSSDTTPTLQIHNGDLFSPSFHPFLPLFLVSRRFCPL